VDILWTTQNIFNKVKSMRAFGGGGSPVPKSISVQAESPDDSGTLFSLQIDDLIVGRGLTAVQAHLLVGEILERVVRPRRGGRQIHAAPADEPLLETASPLASLNAIPDR
jgi:hypothetical protein